MSFEQLPKCLKRIKETIITTAHAAQSESGFDLDELALAH